MQPRRCAVLFVEIGLAMFMAGLAIFMAGGVNDTYTPKYNRFFLEGLRFRYNLNNRFFFGGIKVQIQFK